jgi:dienelactone hydrolase
MVLNIAGMYRPWLWPVLSLITLVVGACSEAAHSPAAPSAETTPAVTPANDVSRGPYAVGEMSLLLGQLSVSRHPGGTFVRPLEVWYPADATSVTTQPRATYNLRGWLPSRVFVELADGDALRVEMDAYRDIPISQHGGFPILLFSHGFAGYRDEASFLTTFLASWGFVVAAPEHLERDLPAVYDNNVGAPGIDVLDLEDTLALLNLENGADRILKGRLDFSRVATIGRSGGGGAAIATAKDAEISAFIAYAPTGLPSGALPAKRGLIFAGNADHVVTAAETESTYERMSAPRRFVAIDGAGDASFTDICPLASSSGGPMKMAADTGFPPPAQVVALYTDGCAPPGVAPEAGWRAIRGLTLAFLQEVLGTGPAKFPGPGTTRFATVGVRIREDGKLSN